MELMTGVLAAGLAPLGAPVRMTHPLVVRSPMLIAHRGGAGLAPENTLVAFRRAVEVWAADMIELDVRATKDGHCVVIHDEMVDRTTNGTGAVRDMTLAELKSLDAGHQFSRDRKTQPFRGTGVTVPTIDEVLEALPDTPITVEVKTGEAQAPLFAAIERHDATQRVVAAGMYDRDRTLFGSWGGAVSASTEQIRDFYRFHNLRLGRFWSIDADVAQIPEFHGSRRLVTQKFVKALHTRGVKVHVWTVNVESDMQRLLDWGVDGLVTDRPDTASRVLHRYVNRPLPPGLTDTANRAGAPD
jgi:glycerophosphoryl diester phosphodiesterase